jgi:hypothetical protein
MPHFLRVNEVDVQCGALWARHCAFNYTETKAILGNSQKGYKKQ